eukprot:jgi/Hompol1/4090/HPOL_006984-RA
MEAAREERERQAKLELAAREAEMFERSVRAARVEEEKRIAREEKERQAKLELAAREAEMFERSVRAAGVEDEMEAAREERERQAKLELEAREAEAFQKSLIAKELLEKQQHDKSILMAAASQESVIARDKITERQAQSLEAFEQHQLTKKG